MKRIGLFSNSSQMAADVARTQSQLRSGTKLTLPPALAQGGDPFRASRLSEMTEGLFDTSEQATVFGQKVADIRQAAGTVASFRQALWLLLRVDNVDPVKRMEITRRAMAWYRARGIAEGNTATPWAKSMVAIARAQQGDLT